MDKCISMSYKTARADRGSLPSIKGGFRTPGNPITLTREYHRLLNELQYEILWDIYSSN